VLSCYVSLRSEFRVVMSVAISHKNYVLVRLYLQLFVGWFISYLRYFRLFAYSDVQCILCCVLFVLLSVSLDCPFLIAHSVFSNVY
jgi:hypothetical protein